MDDLLEQPKKKRRSRYDTSQPIVRKDKILRTDLTEREEQELIPILDLKSRRHPWSYPALPRDYIHALLPHWGGEYMRKRLPILAAAPNNFLRQPEMQTNTRFSGSRFLIYAHPNTSFKEDEFWHDLMSPMMAVHIEIGASQDNLKIIYFLSVINASTMPVDGPRKSVILIPRENKKLRPHYVKPDWEIFGIGKADYSAVRWYCGIEADKGTEPATSREKRKTLQTMIKRALEIDRLNLARTLFGLPEFYFPMVFHSPGRVKTAMELLDGLTDGLGHPRIIFNTFPVYNSFRKPLPPDGSWFRSTFKRVAGKGATWSEDFYMNQL